jgi:hypothetical protein
MTDPRLKICSHPTCVNLFAASQKIAIKKRHVMACSFARQAGGVWWSQMKADSEHHRQVFAKRAKCMWKDSMSTGLTGQGSSSAGMLCKGGWDDD